MSTRDADDRIALLQARAQSERLAAQLALLEVREQLAPLHKVAVAVSSLGRPFARGSSFGPALASLVRLGLRRPQFVLPLATLVFGLLRRRPLPTLLAVSAAAAAWWLFRDERKTAADKPEAER